MSYPDCLVLNLVRETFKELTQLLRLLVGRNLDLPLLIPLLSISCKSKNIKSQI